MMGTLGPAAAPFAFTDRLGGFSEGPYTSLNLSLTQGDEQARVRRNRAAAAKTLGLQNLSWVSVNQVHGNAVVQVTAQASPHIDADGLVTQDANVILAVLVADCVPVVIADAQGTTVAAIHAGWRGTEGRIAAAGAEACARVAQCPIGHLHVHIGPAIGPCCFEVDAPVLQALQQAYPGVQDAWKVLENNRFSIDLWALNARALQDAGVNPQHITISRLCTACSPDHFSHRRDKAPSGRQGALIALPRERA